MNLLSTMSTKTQHAMASAGRYNKLLTNPCWDPPSSSPGMFKNPPQKVCAFVDLSMLSSKDYERSVPSTVSQITVCAYHKMVFVEDSGGRLEEHRKILADSLRATQVHSTISERHLCPGSCLL